MLGDFHMCLNVGDFHMSEHDTAVGMGPKCVWKFDVKYSHRGLIENQSLLYYQMYFRYNQKT